TRYGMRDHMGRGNNLFSHAYIVPLDDFLARPEILCGLDASAFVQDAGRGVTPESESAELARLALSRLQEGRLQDIPPGDIPDFPSALRAAGFYDNRDAYKILLQCVCARMDARREQGQIAPLYIQYEPGDNPDKTFRQILCCLLYGLPVSMRRELRVSNWTELDNTPKDLIFTTEDVTRLSGAGGAYLVLRTGARNVERRRMARLERSGYLPYAALRLPPEHFPAFFDGLDRYAKALGDTDGISESVRKIVWQCYWNPESLSFSDRPAVERLDRKELISLLSDAAESGLYSMGMREIIAAARKRIPLDTLTESLRETLENWDAEYRRRHDMPPKAPDAPETPATPILTEESQFALIRRCAPPSPVDGGRPDPSSVAIDTRPPERGEMSRSDRGGLSYGQGEGFERGENLTEGDRGGLSNAATPETAFAGTPLNPPFQGGLPGLENVSETSSPAPERGGGQGEGAYPPAETSLTPAPLLPVVDWDAAERDWLALPDKRRQSVTEWLGELLDNAPTVPIAEAAFRRQSANLSERDRRLYLLVMIDRQVSGKLNPRAVVRAYCREELARARVKPAAVRWNALSKVASVNERLQAPDLSEQVRDEARELYQKELSPCDTQGRAVTLLRMYEEIIGRLDPGGTENAWNGEQYDTFSRNARKFYWDRVDGNWKYFSFDALDEYDAFRDGRPHAFPTLIRLADGFRVPKAREFLKQVRLFFEASDTPDYYTDENRLRITALLYDELERRHAATLPDHYRGWLNVVTVAEEKNTVPAVQELFDAVSPFDVWKLTESYPRFIWRCKDGGDRKAREAVYPLIRDACFANDAAQTVPLDLWITLGNEAVSFYELHNPFAVFEKFPAAVLRLPPADAVRDSSLMTSPAIRDRAAAYLKYRVPPDIRQAVRGWLDEVNGKRKRF
ncbi:MAG: hypothetical protein IJQ81_07380, partial [Oscillibacter sp.]|nr:hypothetical protein [Oscillibacter sp.]